MSDQNSWERRLDERLDEVAAEAAQASSEALTVKRSFQHLAKDVTKHLADDLDRLREINERLAKNADIAFQIQGTNTKLLTEVHTLSDVVGDGFTRLGRATSLAAIAFVLALVANVGTGAIAYWLVYQAGRAAGLG